MRRNATVPPIPDLPRELTAIIDRGLEDARCKGHSALFDSDVFGETAEERRYRHNRAAVICGRCPVRRRCLAVAKQLPRGLREGVWGGHVFTKRGLTPIEHDLFFLGDDAA